MDYTTVTSPIYADAKNTSISCMVKFSTFDKSLPFIAMANDPEPHGTQIFKDLMDGKYGAIAPYVAPPLSLAQQYGNVIGLGVTVVSTSTPSVNDVYDASDDSIASITEQVQYINSYKEFSTSTPTFNWPDKKGTNHSFTSTNLFLAFGKALTQYNLACKQAVSDTNTGQTAVFPSTTVTIL